MPVTGLFICTPLNTGKFAYFPDSLNRHRRHSESVTISNFDTQQLLEILKMQRKVADSYTLSVKTKSISRKYAQKIYSQFSLDSEYSDIADNPVFKM